MRVASGGVLLFNCGNCAARFVRHLAPAGDDRIGGICWGSVGGVGTHQTMASERHYDDVLIILLLSPLRSRRSLPGADHHAMAVQRVENAC